MNGEKLKYIWTKTNHSHISVYKINPQNSPHLVLPQLNQQHGCLAYQY